MSRKVFRDLVSMAEAKRRLRAHFVPQPLGVDAVPLAGALGRVLADDVEAGIDVPPFDRASMDGFAVHAEDTFGAEEDRPVTLTVVGQVGAGENPAVAVADGEAVEISTGAPVPQGANAVVMVEYTWREQASVRVYRPVAPGDNIMGAGADIMAGELILRRGDVLTARETAVLAALGVTHPQVFRQPRVAVLSTGNEVVAPGTALAYGQIYDINARSLADAVTECHGVPVALGVVGDDRAALTARLKEGLRGADVVLVSGGTSAGVGDLLYRVIDDLGAPGILVHGVAVRPGKPVLIAVVDGTPVFGLPGYPTSALMMFHVFVQPVVRAMAGLPAAVEARTLAARTAERIPASFGRHEYLPVNLVQTEGGDYTVYPVPGGSGAITTLVEADGFIEVPGDRAFLAAGEAVAVELFGREVKPADLMVIGSHCVGIDFLLQLMRRRSHGFRTKVINTGSSGGLAAIRRGEADIAGTHLLDEATGVYNVPFLERYGIADRAVLVRGYIREQCLLVAKGNPKQIQSLDRLLDADVAFINRNPGSGTRLLLDMKLQETAARLQLPLDRLQQCVQGYRVEAKSHTAVAVAVLQGKADVGLAIRAAADRYGLTAIPLTEERYDFVVQKSRLSKPSVQAFLDVLRSTEFRTALPATLPGLSPTDDTGAIIYPPP